MNRKLLLTALILGASLGGAAPAAADSTITIGSGELAFVNEDAGVGNALTIDYDPTGDFHFFDRSDRFGISYPTPPCRPGELNSEGNAVEVFCDKNDTRSINVTIGPGEDNLVYKINDVPATVSTGFGADTVATAGANDSVHGGQGNDTLDAGTGDDQVHGDDGNDTVRGGDGNDKLNGGKHTDVVDGGAGDDNVQASEGSPDKIDCGPGNDSAVVDGFDEVANCETVTKLEVARATDDTVATDDGLTPTILAGGSTSQQVSAKRRRIVVAVTATEPVLIDVSGYIDAGGINERLKPATSSITLGGGGVEVTVTLSKAQLRRALADLRRKRQPKVNLTISGVDAAGNTSTARHFKLWLRKGKAIPPLRAAGGLAFRSSCRGASAGRAFLAQAPPCTAGVDKDADSINDYDDNCQDVWNPTQLDTDVDSGPPPYPPYSVQSRDPARGGDACDIDDDGDEIKDVDDNCRAIANEDQRDSDGDGAGDVCDGAASSGGGSGSGGGSTGGGSKRKGGAVTLTIASLRRGQRLAEIRSGITVPVRCSDSCIIGSELSVDRRTARKLKLARASVIGRGGGGLVAAGKTFIFVRLNSGVLRRLVRARSAKATLRINVKDDSGVKSDVVKRLTLRR